MPLMLIFSQLSVSGEPRPRVLTVQRDDLARRFPQREPDELLAVLPTVGTFKINTIQQAPLVCLQPNYPDTPTEEGGFCSLQARFDFDRI